VANNLPVGLMSGAAIQHAQETSVVAHAILIGVDLGPNLSVTGSLATVASIRAIYRLTLWPNVVLSVAMSLGVAPVPSSTRRKPEPESVRESLT
jgi:Na+/H+ antiporter NhaD/arsenite permease-like protein